MAATAAILDFVSVDDSTNALVDWSDFSGWLEEGTFRWSAPPLIQDGRYGRYLGFGFHRLRGQMPGSIDPLSLAYWGWIEEGSFRWSAPPLSQDGRYCHHLGFGFHWFSDQGLVRFFGGSLGVTGGTFISMISSATHPRWPLRPPSWI
jgi:hypothetical protein